MDIINGIVYKCKTLDNGNTWIVLNDGTNVMIDQSQSLQPGDMISIREYTQYKNRNKTIFYHAKKFDVYNDASRLTIIKYLSSQAFKGIGENYATAIIDFCKDEHGFIDILDNNPDSLFEIKSIPKTVIKQFIKKWSGDKSLHLTIIWLMKLGLSYNIANKINNYFAPYTKSKIEKNPYELIVIDGISFNNADQIASQFGIPRNADIRIFAAIEYILKESLMAGHCYLPYTTLVENTCKLLQSEVGIFDIGNKIKHLISTSKLVDVSDCIYLKYIYDIEKNVSCKIIELMSRKTNIDPQKIEEQLTKIKIDQFKNITLTQKQIAAIRMALQHQVSIITGGPGTGKSLITKYICDLLNGFGIRYELAAPTGRAAKRLMECTGSEARTIHRLLHVQKDGSFYYNSQLCLDTDCVIIDEASMLDIILCNHLLNALSPNTKIIFIGDYNQLPAIGPGNVLKDMIQSERIPCTTLTTIFRQSTKSSIIKVAHMIINGEIPKLPTPKNSKGKNCVMINVENVDTIYEYLTLLIKENLPNIGIAPESIQVISPMRKYDLGINKLNTIIQEVMNPPSTSKPQINFGNCIYRVGDKVMQIHNDYYKDVFNGDIGYIKDIIKDDDQDIIYVEFSDNYKMVEYAKSELNNLQHAFASTIHKSQGIEYDVVILIIHPSQRVMLQRNLLYTGVTRAKKLCIIIGTNSAVEYAILNNSEIQRYTHLKDWLKL